MAYRIINHNSNNNPTTKNILLLVVRDKPIRTDWWEYSNLVNKLYSKILNYILNLILYSLKYYPILLSFIYLFILKKEKHKIKFTHSIQ